MKRAAPNGIGAALFGICPTWRASREDKRAQEGFGRPSGKGYVNTWRLEKNPTNHFPIGYPAIIAALHQVASGVVPLMVLNSPFLLGSVAFVLLICDSFGLPRTAITLVGLVYALCANQLIYTTMVMSEMPYMLLSLAAFYLFLRTDISKSPEMVGLDLSTSLWKAGLLKLQPGIAPGRGAGDLLRSIDWDHADRAWRDDVAYAGTPRAGAMPNWYPAARGPMRTVIASDMQFINDGTGEEELYDLKRDPEQTNNLLDSQNQLDVDTLLFEWHALIDHLPAARK